MSGLIVTPPSDPVPPSKKKRVLRCFRRSLASEFEDVDKSPARGSKFVVLEDD